MADTDVLDARFESRLRAALLRHVADGPTEFDALGFARTVAAKEPRRHGLRGQVSSALTWRGVAVPRVAWVPLLLAALLAALVGGMLVVGSRPTPRLPAVLPPIGTTFTCPPGSTPDKPGPVDQARPTGVGPMAFDGAAGRIVMLEAGTWTFDVCTNTWTLVQSGPEASFASLAYDPIADLTIGVDETGDRVVPAAHAWTYDLESNTWTMRGPAPDHVVWLGYDAASARVAAWAAENGDEPGTIWTYDVASDTWAAVGALEVVGGFGWGAPGDLLAYDASLDRVVTTGGTRTRLLDLRTNLVMDVQAVPPWAGNCYWMSAYFCYGQLASSPIAYDERSERTVVLVAGRMFAYDAVADRWDTLFEPAGTGPGELARGIDGMLYDPVNHRLVVVVQFELFRSADAVLAFDTTTREWTILVAPSEIQPGSTP